jgi:hypothetical protein
MPTALSRQNSPVASDTIHAPAYSVPMFSPPIPATSSSTTNSLRWLRFSGCQAYRHSHGPTGWNTSSRTPLARISFSGSVSGPSPAHRRDANASYTQNTRTPWRALRASRSANARPVASSAKMYISTHTRRRPARSPGTRPERLAVLVQLDRGAVGERDGSGSPPVVVAPAAMLMPARTARRAAWPRVGPLADRTGLAFDPAGFGTDGHIRCVTPEDHLPARGCGRPVRCYIAQLP